MANASSPGGGYHHGCGAQEEELCRQCTGLQEELRSAQRDQLPPLDGDTAWDFGYPLAAGKVLATGGMQFKRNESCNFIEPTLPFLVLTAAIPNAGDPHAGVPGFSAPEYVNLMRRNWMA